ncbi:MAG: hypothetical protein DWQ05_21210 [Calditrichaeota bacterium]|nr:MAG: hypothetical protein DWQ05_21210 [Calditrichota bacterium]
MNIKFFLVSVFVLVTLLYWILPKTKFAQKFRVNIELFYSMNIIGIIFGGVGIVVSFMWPELVMERHYFELILLPILFVYIYTAMLRKSGGGKDIFDEKQNLNMMQAAAATWPMSIFVVFLLYAMYEEGILSGLVFFPLFLFFSFTFYSVSTLYFFKKN